ncbi:hypothetical protein CZ774_15835 [Frigoribacterium sp. JB110]|nr:hypothetical protein CZ774_15835 [Frigoribacterium sp. JB110]
MIEGSGCPGGLLCGVLDDEVQGEAVDQCVQRVDVAGVGETDGDGGPCADRAHLAVEGAPKGLQRRISLRSHAERDGDAHLGAALVVERKQFEQRRSRPLVRMHVRRERLDSRADALTGCRDRTSAYGCLRREEVAKRTRRDPGLGRDPAHGQCRDALGFDHSPRCGDDRTIALVLVHRPWHGSIVAQLCGNVLASSRTVVRERWQ